MGGRSLLPLVVAAALVVCGRAALVGQDGQTRYAMSGLVLDVDARGRHVVISHDSVPGVMAAMTMTFDVRRSKDLMGLEPGMTVDFTLVVDRQAGYVEGIHARPYRSAEQDPLTAERLKILKDAMRGASRAPVLRVGQTVPDFTLTDQQRRPVRLSQLRGQVVAINFIYTRCVLPQFCFRLANDFGALSRRFAMRRDLTLLTVTFDPVHDTPAVLAGYASRWKADPDAWRFLTGEVAEVRRVCGLFGIDSFPDDGVFTHSEHTAVIDRQGALVANIEGNAVPASQLGDLVQTTLNRPAPRRPR